MKISSGKTKTRKEGSALQEKLRMIIIGFSELIAKASYG